MKHLVCLIDGTWVSASKKSVFGQYSNIYKLNLHFDYVAKDGNHQITFYVPGPGSRAGIFSRYVGGVGRGLLDIAEEAYVNIASNFQPGDKIYLFGFSRGAVVARFIAGIISKFGLLEVEQTSKFRHLVEESLFGSRPKNGKRSDSFRLDLSEFKLMKANVEFLGVFDTVFGANFLADSYLKRAVQRDQSLPSKVRCGIHILAMDERRLKFQPQLWTDFEGDPSNRVMEQIWMPGVHSDIGGMHNDDFLGHATLSLMLSRIESYTQLKSQKVEEIDFKDDIVIGGYSGVLSNTLRLFGKRRRYDKNKKHQKLSSICRLANVRTVKINWGPYPKKLPSGKYRFISDSLPWAD